MSRTEQLHRVDRLKTLGEVAAGLAHEIRHPLASIRGALEIIGARSTADTPEAEFSRLALAEVQRLDNLVWEFLRYARPHKPDLRPTSLSDVVERAVALLSVQAERVGVTLRVEDDGPLPAVALDAQQIEQVLLNVILNAIQASPSGAEVRIRDRLERDDVIVDVVDEGTGVPAEHRTQIFSPFFTTKDTGTGLGLPVAQRIVQSHNGHIEVSSTVGRGTCVSIRLPLTSVARSPAEERVEAPV